MNPDCVASTAIRSESSRHRRVFSSWTRARTRSCAWTPPASSPPSPRSRRATASRPGRRVPRCRPTIPTHCRRRLSRRPSAPVRMGPTTWGGWRDFPSSPVRRRSSASRLARRLKCLSAGSPSSSPSPSTRRETRVLQHLDGPEIRTGSLVRVATDGTRTTAHRRPRPTDRSRARPRRRHLHLAPRNLGGNGRGAPDRALIRNERGAGACPLSPRRRACTGGPLASPHRLPGAAS